MPGQSLRSWPSTTTCGVSAEARAVARLLLGLAGGECGACEAVLPAEPVPVVDVEGEGEHARLGFQLREPAFRGPARVAAFGGVELDHRRRRRGAACRHDSAASAGVAAAARMAAAATAKAVAVPCAAMAVRVGVGVGVGERLMVGPRGGRRGYGSALDGRTFRRSVLRVRCIRIAIGGVGRCRRFAIGRKSGGVRPDGSRRPPPRSEDRHETGSIASRPPAADLRPRSAPSTGSTACRRTPPATVKRRSSPRIPRWTAPTSTCSTATRRRARGYVTILANYLPLQDAYGGPNYFTLDPDAIYEVHIDNDGDGDRGPDVPVRLRHRARERRRPASSCRSAAR